MTIHPKLGPASHAVLSVDVEEVSALPSRRLADAIHPGAERRVLSLLSHILNSTKRQHAQKVARSSVNSESVPADPSIVAQSALATWRHIDEALSPIIGMRGVAGLYKRSLSLTRGAHPALTAVFEGLFAPGDYSTLQQALAQQSAPDAIAAGAALLETFNDLLIKLIGRSLTERLLPSLLDNPSLSANAVQDTSP